MIQDLLSRFFLSKRGSAEHDGIHRELFDLKVKNELVERDRRKSRGEEVSKWGRDRELRHWTSLPIAGCNSPRDGAPLLKSEDIMFLAVLLHQSNGISKILEAQDRAGTLCYLPELSGTSQLLKDRGMVIKSKLNASTLRHCFKQTFLLFRSALTSRNEVDHDFFIEGNSIRLSGSTVNNRLWKFGAELERPFDGEGDPLIERLHEEGFFAWLPYGFTKVPSLKHGEVYCPLDGPVLPIQASERTPGHSWEMMCGREWALYLCPKCLGTFDRWAWKMN